MPAQSKTKALQKSKDFGTQSSAGKVQCCQETYASEFKISSEIIYQQGHTKIKVQVTAHEFFGGEGKKQILGGSPDGLTMDPSQSNPHEIIEAKIVTTKDG